MLVGKKMKDVLVLSKNMQLFKKLFMQIDKMIDRVNLCIIIIIFSFMFSY